MNENTNFEYYLYSKKWTQENIENYFQIYLGKVKPVTVPLRKSDLFSYLVPCTEVLLGSLFIDIVSDVKKLFQYYS